MPSGRTPGSREAQVLFACVLSACMSVAVSLVAPAPAFADPKATVSVTVIHARKGPPHLNVVLQPMWDTLRQTFGEKFAYYEVLGQASRKVDSGEPVELQLPTGVRFAAIYNGVTPEKGLLRVNVEMGEFRTKVRIHDGGVFFQAGQKHDGGTLIVAVRAVLDGK